jgi:hypothetical protein
MHAKDNHDGLLNEKHNAKLATFSDSYALLAAEVQRRAERSRRRIRYLRAR